MTMTVLRSKKVALRKKKKNSVENESVGAAARQGAETGTNVSTHHVHLPCPLRAHSSYQLFSAPGGTTIFNVSKRIRDLHIGGFLCHPQAHVRAWGWLQYLYNGIVIGSLSVTTSV